MKDDFMYRLNKAYYDTPGTAEHYHKRDSLLLPEQVIISQLLKKIVDKPFLDIGVGQGRTTEYLRPLTDHYVGIDYSENMLRLCRERYPDTALLLCDARRICFADETFSVVYFSWNAIDDVGHEDRLLMLQEVYRVLKTGGVFFFSSHNLDGQIRSAFSFNGFVSAPNPFAYVVKNAVRLRKYGLNIFNHLKNKKHERRAPSHAILNDPSNNYGLLTYYINMHSQIEQLEELGFKDVDVIGLDGSFVKMKERRTDSWLFYLTRKKP